MKNTLLKIVVAFVLGIGIADALEYRAIDLSQQAYAIAIAACIVLLVGLFFLIPKNGKNALRTIFTIGVLLSFALLGGFRYQQMHDKVVYEWPTEERVYEGKITEGPTERKKTNRYVLLLNGKTVYAYLPKTALYEVGETLRIKARVKAPENFEGLDFDYARFLYHHQVAGTIPYVKERDIEKIAGRRGEKAFLTRVSSLRSQMKRRYAQFGFQDEELGIVTALSVGDKSLLSDAQRDVFSTAGASHVLALSGLHVGIIYMLLSGLLGRKRGERRWRFVKEVVILLSLWLFALLSGMSPSITRAVMMCTIYSLVKMLGNNNKPINTLLLTAMIMLIWQPFQLFDLSFQLSFAAMLGILLIPSSHSGNYFVNILILSVAAQLGTLPLTLHAFGAFPVYFLLTNLIVLPLTYAVMMCIVLWWMVSWTPLVAWATPALCWLVGKMNYVIGSIASLPHSQLHVGKISWATVLILYIVIALIVLLLRRFYKNYSTIRSAMKIEP